MTNADPGELTIRQGRVSHASKKCGRCEVGFLSTLLAEAFWYSSLIFNIIPDFQNCEGDQCDQYVELNFWTIKLMTLVFWNAIKGAHKVGPAILSWSSTPIN